MTVSRAIAVALSRAARTVPVLAILGPRQVGKTTLAHQWAEQHSRPSIYLDLELDTDRSKLADAEDYLRRHESSLVILDEIQRQPDLFPLLRALVDAKVRAGSAAGSFLVLGSASRNLLQQSSESLAGRISYFELTPFLLSEVPTLGSLDRLWLRGGFPRSFLAQDDLESWDWRRQFILTYLERDLPQLGLRAPAELLRRLWAMLAHSQGEILNAARLAAGLGTSGSTVRRYIDLLTDLFMVRQLSAWSGTSAKRLVRAPKIYIRDSGLLHSLLNIQNTEELLGHPICGHSWEGFAIEQMLGALSDRWQSSFYRTSAGAEIDLVLEGPQGRVIALEIKRATAPTLSRGFHLGAQDVQATDRFIVTPRGERRSLGQGVEAVALEEMVKLLQDSDG